MRYLLRSLCLVSSLLKSTTWLQPSDRRDWSSAVIEAVGFSSINFAVLSPVLLPTFLEYGVFAIPLVQIAVVLVALLVAPAAWPYLFVYVLKVHGRAWLLHDRIRHPWDVVFDGRRECWIMVHLKDGRRVGGRFGRRSMASSYPGNAQLYIEEVWRLDDRGAFLQRIERSAGILITSREVEAIEFFE